MSIPDPFLKIAVRNPAATPLCPHRSRPATSRLRTAWAPALLCTVLATGFISCSSKKPQIAATPPAESTPPPAAPATPAPAETAPPAPETAKVVLKVHGSNAIGEKLLPELAKEYLKFEGATGIQVVAGANPDEATVQGQFAGEPLPRAIEIFSHGTASAFKDLKGGTADMGMASRKIKDTEAQDLQPTLGDVTAKASEHLLCMDGIAVIVNKANPVHALTVEQLADIFSGNTTDWAKVGGTAGPIHVFARDEHAGSWDFFNETVLEGRGKLLSSSATRSDDNSKLADAIKADASAIGFVDLPSVGENYAVALSDKTHKSVRPTEDTVKNESYLLSRRLYLYTAAAPDNAEVKKFIEFTGTQGTVVIASAGFIYRSSGKSEPTSTRTASVPAKEQAKEQPKEQPPFQISSVKKLDGPPANVRAESREREFHSSAESEHRAAVQRAAVAFGAH